MATDIPATCSQGVAHNLQLLCSAKPALLHCMHLAARAPLRLQGTGHGVGSVHGPWHCEWAAHAPGGRWTMPAWRSSLLRRARSCSGPSCGASAGRHAGAALERTASQWRMCRQAPLRKHEAEIMPRPLAHCAARVHHASSNRARLPPQLALNVCSTLPNTERW